MKKLVSVLILAGAAAFGYRWFLGWRAYGAYEGFAEAWVHEDRSAGRKYGTEEAVRHAFEDRSLRGTPGGGMMEAFRGTRYSVESKTRSPGGDVELTVKQTVFFDPPGVTSAIGGAMFAHFRDVATVRRTAGEWRVVAFEPTYLDAGDSRRR